MELVATICGRCAAKATKALAEAEQAPVLISDLDEPITREQLRLILEHLAISKLGNMKLYYRVMRCVYGEFWGYIDAHEFLKFMKQPDAEERLKAEGVGQVGMQHLRRIQIFLIGLSSV